MKNELLRGFYNTSPLWKKEQLGITQFEFPKVNLNPSEKIEIPSNLRLGHQMEFVFKHLIHNSGHYQIVGSNLLVEEGKTRIGELDFILKNTSTKKFVHVELAYKFYIINPEISEPIFRLMGPNKRDMFYTKLEKLKEKQFPLLYHHSLSKFWKVFDCRPIDVPQQCCFKAQLFLPYGKKNVGIRPLNKQCIAGNWIRFDDFNSKDFHNARFYIPKKIEWVIAARENVDWMSHYETLMEVNLRMVSQNAPMLWVNWPNHALQKLFVVWW